MAELALREDNAPFSGLGFPYAGIETAVSASKQVDCCLRGIARENAISLWSVTVRLRERVLKANNFRYRFRGRVGGHWFFPSAAPLLVISGRVRPTRGLITRLETKHRSGVWDESRRDVNGRKHVGARGNDTAEQTRRGYGSNEVA